MPRKLQSTIEGVRKSAVQDEAGQAIHWSAAEIKAREAIKAAYETAGKHQWVVGDLLGKIAPNEGIGKDNPEAMAKFDDIASENDKSLRSLQEYRQVAGAVPNRERSRFPFNVAKLFVRKFDDEALGEMEEYAESGAKITYRAVEEYLKSDKEKKAKPTLEEIVEKIVDLFNKNFPSLPDGVPPPELDRQALIALRVLRLGLDNLIGDLEEAE